MSMPTDFEAALIDRRAANLRLLSIVEMIRKLHDRPPQRVLPYRCHDFLRGVVAFGVNIDVQQLATLGYLDVTVVCRAFLEFYQHKSLVLIFFAGEVVFSRLFYWLRIRDQPY